MKVMSLHAPTSAWAGARTIRLGLALLAVTLTSFAAAAPADGEAFSAPPPGLSITLTDGTGQVQSGATVSYTASVANTGAKPVNGVLEITIPSYAAFTGTHSATEKGSEVSWPVTIGGQKKISEKATVRIDTIPKGEVRFTTLATLYATGSTSDILVRTADPDTIRGVVDPAHTVGQPTQARSQSGQPFVAIAITVGAVILVGIVIALVLLTRRRRGNHREWGGDDRPST
jgi:hypothetical protein